MKSRLHRICLLFLVILMTFISLISTASIWPTTKTGRTATYVVAASNAPAHVKSQADYVCDGNGDEVEIQAAINASANYSSIACPGGTYDIDSTLQLKEGMHLYSNSNAVFKAGSVTSNIISLPSLTNNVTISGIRFDGSNTCNVSIYATNLNNLLVEDCHFYSFLVAGIDVDGGATEGGRATGPVICNNYFYNMSAGSGIRIGNDGNIRDYSRIKNNTFSGCQTGIRIVTGHNGIILGNTISGSVSAGINLASDRWAISSNLINHNQTGIFCGLGTANNVISDNYILRNTYEGLSYYGGVDGDCVSGNIIYGNGESDEGSSHDCEIRFNSCTNIRFYDNKIGKTGETDPLVPIYAVHNGDTITLEQNTIVPTGATVITNPTNLSGSTYLRNVGYVTENSGNVTLAAGLGAVDVTHGLAVTPTSIMATIYGNPGVATTLYTGNFSSTKFTVYATTNFTNSTPIYWRATAGAGN